MSTRAFLSVYYIDKYIDNSNNITATTGSNVSDVTMVSTMGEDEDKGKAAAPAAPSVDITAEKKSTVGSVVTHEGSAKIKASDESQVMGISTGRAAPPAPAPPVEDPAEKAKLEHRARVTVPVIIAIIGLIGVLAAALISAFWKKDTPAVAPSNSPPAGTASASAR